MTQTRATAVRGGSAGSAGKERSKPRRRCPAAAHLGRPLPQHLGGKHLRHHHRCLGGGHHRRRERDSLELLCCVPPTAGCPSLTPATWSSEKEESHVHIGRCEKARSQNY